MSTPTTHGYFLKPDYTEHGLILWTLFTAALDIADAAIYALVTAVSALNTIVTGWAVTENQDIFIPNCAYAAANQFTVVGADLTSQFTANKPIRAQLSDNTFAGSTVSSSSYAAGDTTVTINDAILTDPIGGIWLTATRDGLFPYGPGYIVARDYGTPGTAAWDAALAAAGILERTTILGPGAWDRPTTDPLANITTFAERGAVIDPGATDLTFENFAAGRYKVFDCTGAGKVRLNSGYALADWFGVDPSESAANNQAFLQLAVDAISLVGGKVEITRPGTYHSDGLISGASHVEVILGPGVIWDNVSGEASFEALGTVIASTVLTASAVAGATSLTVSDETDFAAGQKVWIYYTTMDGQVDVSIVDSTAAGTINLIMPLCFAWNHLRAGGGVTVKGVEPVENFRISGQGKIQNLTGLATQQLIRFMWAWNCHVMPGLTLEAPGTTGVRAVLMSESTGPKCSAFCSATGLFVIDGGENGIESYLGSAFNRIDNNVVLKAASHCYSLRGSNHQMNFNRGFNSGSDGYSLGNIFGGSGVGNYMDGVAAGDHGGFRFYGESHNFNLSHFSAKNCPRPLYIYADDPTTITGIGIGPCDLTGNTLPAYVSPGAGVTFVKGGNLPTLAHCAYLGTSTTGTGEDLLKTHPITIGTILARGGFRWKATFVRSGANDVVTAKIYLETSLMATASLAAVDANPLTITGTFTALDIPANGGYVSVECFGDGTVEGIEYNLIAENLETALNFLITGECANASDSLSLRELIIEPLGLAF